MTIPTHVLLGTIIGKVTGNYTLAIAASVAPDLDHFASYLKSGVIKSPRVFWNTIMAQDDPYGDQRGIFHNVLFFLLISVILFLLIPAFTLPITLGWLGHILLDMADNSDYWPLYPNKKFNARGPICYASFQEGIIFCALLVIYFLIIFI